MFLNELHLFLCKMKIFELFDGFGAYFTDAFDPLEGLLAGFEDG